MLPLISVIVPVYNVEKYLSQCVKSLIGQTYQSIEILLIDDGSKDSSGKICDQFAKKYSNVVAYHKSNSGLGLTRNYGLERATGEYVTFVDSDDYLRQDAIQNLVLGLENEKNDTVIGGFTKITDDGRKLYIESYPQEIVKGNKVYSELFSRMLGSSPNRHDSIKPSVWNTLYSLRIIQQNHLQFVSERKLISEDIVWDSDYYCYSKSVKVINSPAYYYRANPNSLTKKYDPNRFNRSIIFYEHMVDKMSKTEISKDARLRLTRNLFVSVRFCLSQGSYRTFSQVHKSVSEVCSNLVLQKSISRYPVNNLNLKQRLFVLMIKRKYTIFLTVLTKMNLV